MFLARVEGAVVSTKKDPSMSGRKLLLLRPQLVDEKDPGKFRPGLTTGESPDLCGRGMAPARYCGGAAAAICARLSRSSGEETA